MAGSRLREAQDLFRLVAARIPGMEGAVVPDFQALEGSSSQTRPGENARDLLLKRAEQRPALFRYQSEIVDLLVGGSDWSPALVALPTGAGKTRTALVALLDLIGSGRSQSVIWLAPTLELLDQAMSTADRLWRDHGGVPDLLLRRGSGDQMYLDWDGACISFATPQSIYARMGDPSFTSAADTVVFDEAHQLGAPTFRSAVELLAGDFREVRLLGLSATPGRAGRGGASETEDLVELFGGRLLTSPSLGADPVRKLQRLGVLSELRFRQLTQRSIAADDVVERLRIAANACRAMARRGRRALVFTSSVASANALAGILQHLDVAADSLHSGLEDAIRRERLDRFADGRVAVMCNHRLLATGYDCPAISDVLLLTPIRSPILFEQMVGRGARGPRTGGRRSANIWQFDDHLKLHGRPSSYYRYRDFAWSTSGWS